MAKAIEEQAAAEKDRTLGVLVGVAQGDTITLFKARETWEPVDPKLGLGAVLGDVNTPRKPVITVDASEFKRTPTGFMRLRGNYGREKPVPADQVVTWGWAHTTMGAIVLCQAALWESADMHQQRIEAAHQVLAACERYLTDLKDTAADRDMVPNG